MARHTVIRFHGSVYRQCRCLARHPGPRRTEALQESTRKSYPSTQRLSSTVSYLHLYQDQRLVLQRSAPRSHRTSTSCSQSHVQRTPQLPRTPSTSRQRLSREHARARRAESHPRCLSRGCPSPNVPHRCIRWEETCFSLSGWLESSTIWLTRT